VTSQAIFDTLN